MIGFVLECMRMHINRCLLLCDFVYLGETRWTDEQRCACSTLCTTTATVCGGVSWCLYSNSLLWLQRVRICSLCNTWMALPLCGSCKSEFDNSLMSFPFCSIFWGPVNIFLCSQKLSVILFAENRFISPNE